MNAGFLAGKSPEFVVRARKLASILDPRFDAFGDLVAEDTLDWVVTVLEAIDEAGCQLIFADDASCQTPVRP